MKSKKELNEEIAQILGFKEYGIRINGVENAVTAWSYPTEYCYLAVAAPMYNCPDFIKMIEDNRKIQDITRGWKL